MCQLHCHAAAADGAALLGWHSLAAESSRGRRIGHVTGALSAKRMTDNHPGLPSPTVNAEAGVHLANRGGCEPTTPLDAPQITSTRFLYRDIAAPSFGTYMVYPAMSSNNEL